MPYDRAQILTELELGIRYLQNRCPPLKGFEYAIRWHEHELGDYPDICLVWEEDSVATPWGLIENAQRCLETFDEAVDWSAIWEVDEEEEGDVHGTADGRLASNPDEDPEFDEHRDDPCTALKVHTKLEIVEMLPGEYRRDRVLSPAEEAIYFTAARSSKMEKHKDPTLLADVDTILIDCGPRPEEMFPPAACQRDGRGH